MNEIIEWLDSPEGRQWSREHFRPIFNLVSVKDDVSLESEFHAFIWWSPLEYSDEQEEFEPA
jgi:hypothetical protein